MTIIAIDTYDTDPVCDFCAASGITTPATLQTAECVSEIAGTLLRHARPMRLCQCCADAGIEI